MVPSCTNSRSAVCAFVVGANFVAFLVQCLQGEKERTTLEKVQLDRLGRAPLQRLNTGRRPASGNERPLSWMERPLRNTLPARCALARCCS